MIGGEHGSECRGHAIKAGIGKRQLLRVPLNPFDLHTRFGSMPPGLREQLGRDVQADHLRTELGSRNRDVTAASRTHIKQSQPRLSPDPIDDQPTDRFDQPSEAFPISRRPGSPCMNAKTVRAVHQPTLPKRPSADEAHSAHERHRTGTRSRYACGIVAMAATAIRSVSRGIGHRTLSACPQRNDQRTRRSGTLGG